MGTNSTTSHESGDPILDAAGVRLSRARLLYVRTTTRPEREAVSVIEGHLARRHSPMNVRRLGVAREALIRAEVQANEIFDAVLNGEVEP